MKHKNRWDFSPDMVGLDLRVFWKYYNQICDATGTCLTDARDHLLLGLCPRPTEVLKERILTIEEV